MLGKMPLNKTKRKFKFFSLNAGLFVALTVFGSLLFMLVNPQKVFADDKLRATESEQHSRTKAKAFIKCLEGGATSNKNGEFHIGGETQLGHDIPRGNDASCDSIVEDIIPMLFPDMKDKNRIGLMNKYIEQDTYLKTLPNAPFNNVKEAWIATLEAYSEKRLPMLRSEEIRRIRSTMQVCADSVETLALNNDSYFQINDNIFRFKEGPRKTVSTGHDWIGGGDGQNECGTIRDRAKAINAYDQNADNILAYEAECVLEGVPAPAIFPVALDVCIANKVATRGPGDSDAGMGGATDAESEIECDTISWNPLKWFLCPVIKIAEKAVGALDNLITYLLSFPTKQYFEDNDGMQKAWARFRNLSIGLLLIAGLVMVISQAIGSGPFDAYTIKRVMPRMLFAVVFISISFSVLRVMIEFTNIAGIGIRNLIETSFGSEAFGNVTFNNGAMAFGNLAGAALGLSLGFMGILSLLGTALLGVLIAFVVLVARQMVIIMLVVLAPVAIACYILPNTEKVWKMWWDFFIRAIFAFPIISMFIAVGHAFAYIASQSTGMEGSDSTLHDTIASLIAFAAYFGPYFALPFAFRLAGGAVAQIGGVANDRSRGAFDRMKNFRKQKSAQNMSDWAHGDRFSSNNVFARGVNRVGIGAKSGWKGRFGMGARGQEARARILQTGGNAALANNQELSSFLDRNDDAVAVLGLSGGTTRGAREATADLRRAWIRSGTGEHEATERANRALAAASAMGITRQNAGAAWTKMGQNKSRAIPAGDLELLQSGAQRLGHGNATAVQEMAWGHQYNSRNSGRAAESGDWTSAEVQGHLDAATAARAAGNDAAADQHLFEAQRATFMDGVRRTGVGSITGGHSSSTEMAERIIQDDFASADMTRRMDSAVLLSELAGQLPSATGENRDNIVRTLTNAGIDPSLVEAAGMAPVAIGTNPDGSIIYDMQPQEAAVSIDQQIVRIVNSTPGLPAGAGGGVTTKDLDAAKRSWGATPPGARTT